MSFVINHKKRLLNWLLVFAFVLSDGKFFTSTYECTSTVRMHLYNHVSICSIQNSGNLKPSGVTFLQLYFL